MTLDVAQVVYVTSIVGGWDGMGWVIPALYEGV